MVTTLQMLDLPVEVIQRILSHLPLSHSALFLSHPQTRLIALEILFSTVMVENYSPRVCCRHCGPDEQGKPTSVAMKDHHLELTFEAFRSLLDAGTRRESEGLEIKRATQRALDKALGTTSDTATTIGSIDWETARFTNVIMALGTNDGSVTHVLNPTKRFLHALQRQVSRMHLRIEGLGEYPPNGFRNLTNLLSLLLAHPTLDENGDLGLPDDCLKDVDILGSRWPQVIYQRYPDSVERLGLAQNQIQQIDPHRVCWPLRLQSLGLDANFINEMGGLTHLPHTLTHLSLSHNNVSRVPPSFAFPPLLVSLNMSANLLTTFPALQHCVHLEELVLALNNLTHIGDLPPSLKRMDLGDNQLTSLDGVRFPEGFEELLVGYNRITSLEQALLPLTLTRLSMGNNHLLSSPLTGGSDHIFQPLETLQGLVTLDLSHNNLCNLNLALLTLPDTVEGLVLNNCHLGLIDTMHWPRCLEVLHLQENHIAKVAKVQFPPRLREVYLNGNTIEDFASLQVPSSLERIGTPNFRVVNPQGCRIPARISALFV